MLRETRDRKQKIPELVRRTVLAYQWVLRLTHYEAVEKGLEGIKDDIQNESGAQRDQRQKEEARRQEEDARRNTEDAVRRKKETGQ